MFWYQSVQFWHEVLLSRNCIGIVLVLSWYRICIALVLYGYCLGIALVLYWCRFGVVLALFWYCVGIGIGFLLVVH